MLCTVIAKIDGLVVIGCNGRKVARYYNWSKAQVQQYENEYKERES